MATEIVKTIRASGGDYTTLSAWEAALPASLVTADEQHTAVCYNDWPSGLDDPVVITGSTTDATRFLKVTVATGHRHDGTGNHTGFYLKGDKGAHSAYFQNTVSYTQIEWLDVEHTRNTNSAHAIYGLVSVGGMAKNCIGKTNNNTNTTVKAFSWASNSNTESTWPIVFNCLADRAYVGFANVADAGRLRSKYYNCTAANCNTGFPGHATIPGTAINCVAHDCTTGFTTGWQAASGYNASSDTTATTLFSNSVSGIVDADFIDATGGDFHLASGSALIGVGSNLYSLFTADIDDDIRPSSGAWDIGFDHYVSAGATGTISATESGSDVAAVSGVVLVSGTITATESGADTAGVTGDVYVSGALSSSESGPDVASIIGGLVTPAITGTISATEVGSDAASISGDVLVRGSISAAEAGADTALLSGDTIVSGALSASETGSDTAFINGSSAIISTGALSASEVGADGCTVIGKVYLSGELSTIEGALDGFAASGNIYVSGALAASESGTDSAAIAGTSAIIAVGTLAVTESGVDGCSANGKVHIAGELSAVEGALDAFAVSGNILISGLLTASESGTDTAYIYETPIRPRRPLPDIFVKYEQQRAFVHSRRLDIWVKSPSESSSHG